MNRLSNPLVLGAAIVLLLLLVASVFTIKETERAIKLRLGTISQSEYDPGLHFKLPLFERVIKFDRRILTVDVRPGLVLTQEKKNVIVDFFIKWRIDDTTKYYRLLGGIDARASSRLTELGNKNLRNAFKQRTIREVVSSSRSTLMSEIRDSLALDAAEFGIEIVDVRVKKVELPEDVRESVFQRMEKDREKIAREIRSEGEESAKKIRALADRVREETLATAYAEAESTRGDGDGESARIYADAYSRNPEFYSLYRSLSAYRSAFSGSNDVLLLSPDSEFFRYFNGSTGVAGRPAVGK